MTREASLTDPSSAVHDRLVVFIGGGQMASALAAGLLHAGWRVSDIVVVEPNDAQRHRIGETLGVRTLAGADPILSEAHVVVWAVKPQAFASAVKPLLGALRAPLHLSIVAGVAICDLSGWLGSQRIVRAMPNTPSLVGAGVTAMLASPGVTVADRQLAESLLSATAHTFWVDSDERIDAVTAVSGSGPGFIFQFLEDLQAAAQALGFSQAQARELVIGTAAGSIALARSDDTPLSILRERVTSKGGTTEAGLAVLASHHLSSAVPLAVRSAYEKAQELSKAFSESSNDHRID